MVRGYSHARRMHRNIAMTASFTRLDAFSRNPCSSETLSTLHGCVYNSSFCFAAFTALANPNPDDLMEAMHHPSSCSQTASTKFLKSLSALVAFSSASVILHPNLRETWRCTWRWSFPRASNCFMPAEGHVPSRVSSIKISLGNAPLRPGQYSF